MSDLKACRICLRNESKFYSIDACNLNLYYEDITSLPLSNKDVLPPYFCYHCAALLYKFHRFKEKCLEGHRVLMEMLFNGPITYAGISELNAKKVYKCQQGSLEIVTINDRVKTYHTEYSKLVKEENTNRFKEEIIGEEYSDGSLPHYDEHECEDPQSDPVAETIPMGSKSDDAMTDNDIAVIQVQIHSGLDINELKDPELEEVEGLNAIEQEVVTPKAKVKRKVKQKGRVKQAKKKYTKRKQRSEPESDSDSSDELLSDVKAKKSVSVISPNIRKKYKFEKPKTKLRNLAFLDSGYWLKSSLNEEEALRNFEARAKDTKYLNAAFKCVLCYKGFSQMAMLDRHIPQRHGEALGKLVCRFCKMRFKSPYYLNRHMRQHYTKYECLRCGLVCNLDSSALLHEEYHSGVVRKCPHCDKEFKHLSTFYTHLRTHRSKHMCAVCGESFVSELGLRLHTKAKHMTETEPAIKPMPENMYCDVCQMKFLTKDAYFKHLTHSAMHTDFYDKLSAPSVMDTDQCKTLDVNLESSHLKENDDDGIKEEKRVIGELLRRRSTVEKTLSAFRKSHPRRIAKKPTTCHQCGKHFETQAACKKHHLSEHPRTSFYSPTQRVICEVCGNSLAPGSVAAHLNQHNRTKMHTCDTCGRSFTTSTMLRTHLVTHTGEKKYGCTLCDKRFTQNGSLSLHYRTFHLKQPYPKRNRRKKVDKPISEGISGKEE